MFQFCAIFRQRIENGADILNFSERLIKNVADLMVLHGYKDAGYEYVIIDDCWLENERDAITNELVADRKRFPNGIGALADYVSRMTIAVFFSHRHTKYIHKI